MIFVGIDDTDIVGSPGTNQLARLILKRIGEHAKDSIICRHQLFFDPRVPYTSKNGSASIQLPNVEPSDIPNLTDTIRETMRGWYVEGSDPGLCIAACASEEMKGFGFRCKSNVVTQEEARAIAADTASVSCAENPTSVCAIIVVAGCILVLVILTDKTNKRRNELRMRTRSALLYSQPPI